MPRVHDQHFPDDDDTPEGPSRTQLKKQAQDLQVLGQAVAELPASRRDKLVMAERLRDAIDEWHRTKSFEGKRRQIQYIGKLMRFEDVEPMREAVSAYKLGSASDTLALHETELWRDRLIADDAALADWIAQYPATDIQQLRSLVRAARKDAQADATRHGRAFRELFQLVKRQRAGDSATAAPLDEAGDDAHDA